MSEQLPSTQYIDLFNPDYEQLAGLLQQHLDNSPVAEDLSAFTGKGLVAFVIWYAKEENQARPEVVVSEIFGPDVWGSEEDWT